MTTKKKATPKAPAKKPAPKAKGPQRTDLMVLLDRSGSMATIKHDMEGGFNTMMGDQRKLPGELAVTLIQFDSGGTDTVYEGTPVADVPPLDLQPRYSTPLIDALVRTIDRQAERVAAAKPDKVVFLLITDGEENSSKEFGLAAAQERVKAHPDWEFVFLGANMDAIKVAQSVGMAGASAMTYQPSAGSVASSYSSVSANLSNVRSGASQTMDWTEQQRKDAAK